MRPVVLLFTAITVLAAVSISVPSTLKCSSESSHWQSASHTTSSNSAWPILCSNSLRRFFASTVGSKLRSIKFMSKNQRN